MAKTKQAEPGADVELTAYWGEGDRSGTIKVSRQRWAAIQAGAVYDSDATSWYEEWEFRVRWSFANGYVSIVDVSIDGFPIDCLVEEPIDSLVVKPI